MPKEVQSQEAEMILRPEDPDRNAVEDDDARRGQDLFVGAADLDERSVQIDGASIQGDGGQQFLSAYVVGLGNVEVEVSIGAERRVRILPRDGPSLAENGIHAGTAEDTEHGLDP
jgi:hypothetical protein